MDRIVLKWEFDKKNDKEACLVLKEGAHSALFSNTVLILACNPPNKKDNEKQASELQLKIKEQFSLLRTNVQLLVNKVLFDSAALAIVLQYPWKYYYRSIIERKLKELIPEIEFIG
ncbi:MAG TPA: hypothetical protein VLB02_00920 [Candidatus Paceibacterota bacterium]|nr:hypothetical protein [Candidatus Paceibacterota bacterium]